MEWNLDMEVNVVVLTFLQLEESEVVVLLVLGC